MIHPIFRNTPRLTGIKIFEKAHDKKAKDVRIADTLAGLLSLPLPEMIDLFKDYAFYESEYTPMIKSTLKVYRASGLLTDKQRVALAMYLASHPDGVQVERRA